MRKSHKAIIGGGVAAVLAVAATVGVIVNSASAAEAPAPKTIAATSVTLPKESVTSWHVKDHSLNAVDIDAASVKWFTGGPYNNTVNSFTVKDGSLGEGDLNTALQAKVNKPGLTGVESDSPYPGALQLADNPGQGANSTVKFVADGGKTLQRAWVVCADGKTALGGGYQRGDEGVASIHNLQIVTSAATQIEKGADGKYGEVYKPIAGDKAGSVKPNAWLVEGFNNAPEGGEDLIVRPSIICGVN